MELRDVETFLEVARELHFGRSASHLRVSQGRVSQTIIGLERQVGGRLFERTSRRVQLTELGELFRRRVQRGYDELVEALQECRAFAHGDAQHFRVAYWSTVGGAWLSQVAAAFVASRPECKLVLNSFIPQRNLRMPALLESLGADLGVLWSPGGDGSAVQDPRLTVGPVLAEAQRGVIVPKNHPLAHHRAVSLESLRDYQFLRLPDTLDKNLREQWTPQSTPSGRELYYTAEDLCQLTGRENVPDEDVLTLVAQRRGLYLTIVSLLDQIPFSELTVVPVYDMPTAVIVPVWLDTCETATTHEFVRVAATVARFPYPLGI